MKIRPKPHFRLKQAEKQGLPRQKYWFSTKGSPYHSDNLNDICAPKKEFKIISLHS